MIPSQPNPLPPAATHPLLKRVSLPRPLIPHQVQLGICALCLALDALHLQPRSAAVRLLPKRANLPRLLTPHQAPLGICVPRLALVVPLPRPPSTVIQVPRNPLQRALTRPRFRHLPLRVGTYVLCLVLVVPPPRSQLAVARSQIHPLLRRANCPQPLTPHLPARPGIRVPCLVLGAPRLLSPCRSRLPRQVNLPRPLVLPALLGTCVPYLVLVAPLPQPLRAVTLFQPNRPQPCRPNLPWLAVPSSAPISHSPVRPVTCVCCLALDVHLLPPQ